MSVVEFYRQQARALALHARRLRFMRQDVTHELWAFRAKASLMLMRLVIEEEARYLAQARSTRRSNS